MSTALVLVDIQNDYFPGGKMELVGMKPASDLAAKLLERFRDREMPTFHIQHIFEPDSGAGFFDRGSEGAEISECIKPMAGEKVITKHFPSSFRETKFEEELRNANIDNLVVCGAMSHMCIDATVRTAADLGFNCTVIQDACATRDLEFKGKTIGAGEVHGSFMSALGFAYAKVIDFEEFKEQND